MKKAIISIVLIMAVVCSLFVFIGCEDGETTYTINFYDGSNIISTQSIKSIDELTIPTPTKTDYEFAGWYLDEKLENAFSKDGYQLDSTTINLYAKWNSTSVASYKVAFYDGETLYTQQSISKVEDLIVPTISKSGYVFIGWYTDTEFTSQFIKATFKLTADTNLYAKFMTEADYYAQQNKIVKELNPETGLNEYYFFIGINYSFNDTEIEVSGNANNVLTNISKTGFTPVALGDFTITFKNNDMTRAAHVLYYITDISIDADYNAAWITRDIADNDFLNDSADDVMFVGKQNFAPAVTYYVDTNTTANYSSLELTYTVKDLSNNTVVADNKYSINDRGAISFDDSLVGKTVALTIAPKYDVNANLHPITIKAEINNGVNVYTNEELQTAYADRSVQCINILRNITAAFKESDLIYTTKEGRKAPTNTYETAVYYRNAASTSGDNLVVNGNYFMIDGSNLEYIDNRCGDERNYDSTAGGFAVSNVQVGIFTYRSYVESAGEKYYYQDNKIAVNNLKITGNNVGASNEILLTQDGQRAPVVTGTNDKTTTETVAKDSQGNFIAPSGKYFIAKNGASLNGFVARSGDVTLNNVDIDNVNIAVFSESHKDDSDWDKPSGKITLNYTSIDNAWSNAAYYWGITDVNLNHVRIGQCGGVSMVVDDQSQASNYVTEIKLTDYVDNNYLTGEETWFIARGATEAAAALKSQDSQYNQLTKGIAGADGIKTYYPAASERTMQYNINGESKFLAPLYVRGCDDKDEFDDALAEYKAHANITDTDYALVHNDTKVVFTYRDSEEDIPSSIVFNFSDVADYMATPAANLPNIFAKYLCYPNEQQYDKATIAYVITH